ncbi:MAG: hypothetical protein Q9198_008026 [Flavoplaca austrocitrina]
MPYFPDSQQWLQQSSLLLEARPTTTRITTKYRISPPPPLRKSKPAEPDDSTSATSPPPAQQQQPLQSRANLVLKTYDPASGVCLKYRTDKAAEVGRLVAALGRCARTMAGLPPKDEGAVEEPVGEGKMDVDKPEMKPDAGTKDPTKSNTQGQAQMQGKGGGGKKKKGKR